MPEKIPHIAPSTPNGQTPNGHGHINSQDKNLSGSPVKEHTFLHRETSLNRETSAEELEDEAQKDEATKA